MFGRHFPSFDSVAYFNPTRKVLRIRPVGSERLQVQAPFASVGIVTFKAVLMKKRAPGRFFWKTRTSPEGAEAKEQPLPMQTETGHKDSDLEGSVWPPRFQTVCAAIHFWLERVLQMAIVVASFPWQSNCSGQSRKRDTVSDQRLAHALSHGRATSWGTVRES
jgi:hypothetical protein